MARDPYRNDALRRALEQVESPLEKALRQMENDPATRALRELEDSPAFRAARMLEQAESPVQRLAREMQNDPVRQAIEQLEQSSALRAAERLHGTDFQRLATSLVEAQSAFAAYANSQHWAETSAAIAAAHSAITRPETVDVLRRIDADLKGLVTAAHQAVVPLAEQLQSFSVAAAAAVHPFQERFQQVEAWQSSLAERMAQLQNPWAIEDHLGVSMVGFARIARLHDISSGTEPFNPAGQEVFAEELGEPVDFDENQSPEDRETARIDAGMNAEIVAFPPAAYPHVLFSAGFQLRVEAVATVTTENGDETGRYDPQHASFLGQIENRLRDLVQAELSHLEGENWLERRINGDLRKRWRERKIADHDRRGDSYPLLYYADFMDLADIICQRHNWNDAFERFFQSKPDFQASMQRLAPVRNTIGHNRPLVRADQITLLAEGYRILNALGVRM
ncbi:MULTISPECIES: Swt1 family HEPN domain-containing protein [unclassified Sulfitobacter]|uniref:Swt1 family HEPN domain-containing protein n=1 Tax=unclassified Sulfitobacter TaxID=196795 RepID=UPI003745D4CD